MNPPGLANLAESLLKGEEAASENGAHKAGNGGAHTGEPASAQRNLDAILKIPVKVQIVLGGATLSVANLMKLGRGAVLPLDRRVGEPVDMLVNGRLVARGEMMVLEDDNTRFGISLTEVVGAQESERTG
jgi:flagellar motor switch protein FliN/FliY